MYDGAESKYIRHVDNDVVGSDEGWEWRNARVLTAILYLNPPAPSGAAAAAGAGAAGAGAEWSAEDGGALRCWPSAEGVDAAQDQEPDSGAAGAGGSDGVGCPFVDVLPTGGTVRNMQPPRSGCACSL